MNGTAESRAPRRNVKAHANTTISALALAGV